jgi:hypothetical protein
MSVLQRAERRLPKLLAQLNTTARLHPRIGRTVDGRENIEAALRKCLLLTRQADARRLQAALADAIADAPLNKSDKL